MTVMQRPAPLRDGSRFTLRRAPVSNLGADADRVSLMPFCLRVARVALHLMFALLLCVVIRLDFTGRVDVDDWVRRWLKSLMRILGLKIITRGTPAAGGQMIVCNHVSWLDIPLLGAALTGRFVAKSDIRHWPLIGFIARPIGTFFIRRGAGGSRPLLDKLKPHLMAGGAVVIFPEGTTTDGHRVLPFHPRLFQAAVECHAIVQPVALRYGRSLAGEDIAPFIGDDNLFAHVVRVLGSPGLAAELVYCEPLKPRDHPGRAALARAAEEAIRQVVAPETIVATPAAFKLEPQAKAA